MNRMDSTVLAFSYKYGFISRGLVGTFYQWLDEILPADLMNQEAVVTYTLCVTLIFYVLMLGFFGLLSVQSRYLRWQSDVCHCFFYSFCGTHIFGAF